GLVLSVVCRDLPRKVWPTMNYQKGQEKRFNQDYSWFQRARRGRSCRKSQFGLFVAALQHGYIFGSPQGYTPSPQFPSSPLGGTTMPRTPYTRRHFLRLASPVLAGAALGSLSLRDEIDCRASAEENEAPIRFTEQLILDRYGYAYGLAAADIDGD